VLDVRAQPENAQPENAQAGNAQPEPDRGPAERYRRPAGVGDRTVEAAGKMSEALEYVHRARGALYEMHQLIGRADLLFEEAAGLLADAGHGDIARHVEEDLVGRNVLPGRWTFQIVEEFDDGYWSAAIAAEALVRDELLAGRRHVYESEWKQRRRTPGRRGHEERPADL
jgi:hypothetical protein